MSRTQLIAFAFALCAFAPVASAQDDTKKSAAAAEKLRADIQKQLAAGTDNQKHLRLDKFEPGAGAVNIVGVYLDVPATGADAPVPFDQATDELIKTLRDKLKVPALKFDVTGITRIPPDKHPHVILQLAANAAGAKGERAADECKFDDSRFNAAGTLMLTGTCGKDAAVARWIAVAVPANLGKHPAVRLRADKPEIVADIKPVEWKTSAAAIQKLLAASGKADGTAEEKDRFALRRLGVDRAYFTYQVAKDAPATLRFRIEGVRLGEGEVKVEAAQDVIGPVVAGVAGKPIPGDYGLLVGTVIEEPVKPIHAAVVARPALDGVRVDPGFTFGPEGELLPAGVQPGLSAEGRKELQAVVQAALAAHGRGKPLAAKYAAVAKRPVAFKGMTVLPVGKVMDGLRAWAIRSKDDLKLLRLYFPGDLSALKKRYTVEEGGLVLLYRPSNAADIPQVEAEFKRLLKVHLEGGIPQPPGGGPSLADTGTKEEKEPLLPGLTAHLRKEMAADQKKWNGVLIERGYFDARNRYVLRGVADSAAQGILLGKLLAERKEDPKWADYFETLPYILDFTVIPMAEMLDRVRRVTPAYPVFDGLRIESARYDADVNLIFEAHVAGTPDRDAAATLAKLLRDSATYGRRAPAGKQITIVKIDGPAYPDDQLGNFSLAYGGKLLSKAGASKKARANAKEWLDLAMLHYPNESAVWFLSAYYNHAFEKDAELTRRDLYRVIGLEGTVAFNGPAQRKRRYESAKDLQGTTRDKLELLWLECFREVKDGADPITMTKK